MKFWNSDHQLISIGVVIKAHGIQGELDMIALTDDPEQFKVGTAVHLNLKGEYKRYKIEKVRSVPHKMILKLEGVDDRTTAQSLKGAYLEKERGELHELTEDEYFIFDLIGLTVKTLAGAYLGKLTDVWTLTANDVYIVHDGEKELLIPAIKDVIEKVDLDRKEMIIVPIDGLLE